jgi:hypothetical protein
MAMLGSAIAKKGPIAKRRRMADSRVEDWKRTGDLWLWKYGQNTRNYFGWNLAADRLGCESLLDLLGRMAASPRDCRREISVIRPTRRILAVPNNPGGSAGLESPPCLRLQVRRDRVGDRHWRLESDPARVAIEVGPSKLIELRAAVASMPSTGGDFAIGSDERTARRETSLWLWLVPDM